MTEPLLAVLGPTCAWKTTVAVSLARRLGAHIVSCDSMQVYRGMDVGTATPPPELRAEIPHHLVSELDIHERYDANRFVNRAEAVLDDLQGRGVPAILVGGTGLYAKAFIYRLELLPTAPHVLRQVLADLESANGEQRLRAELRNSGPDPDVPESVLTNPRRLARAVEVLRITGKPPWHHHPRSNTTPTPRCKQVVIMPAAAIQKERIKQRTETMLENGWIEETERLLDMGLMDTPTARQALGYRDVAAFLRGSIRTHEELRQTVTAQTVRYARRQRTWFRHQHPGARILNISDDYPEENIPGKLVDTILQFWNR